MINMKCTKPDLPKILILYGKTYSSLLGIRLSGKRESEIFKWFIASVLLGARINETLAVRTYRQLGSDGLLSFNKMSEAGWDGLVSSLDAGGYVRYDFSTASDLVSMMKLLKEKYDGKLGTVHKLAADQRDLEKRLQEFRGVGPVTMNIFLRDLRGVWSKADPPLGHIAAKAARDLGLKDPKAFWENNKVRGYGYVNFETALMRIGREARRKKRSALGILKEKHLYIL